jgi:hypothetical protein
MIPKGTKKEYVIYNKYMGKRISWDQVLTEEHSSIRNCILCLQGMDRQLYCLQNHVWKFLYLQIITFLTLIDHNFGYSKLYTNSLVPHMHATCLANHILFYLIALTTLDVEDRTSFVFIYVVETDKGPCCQNIWKSPWGRLNIFQLAALTCEL